MRFSILTFNNYVGILTDAIILNELFNKIDIQNEIVFLDKIERNYKSDVGIWIQNYYEHMVENFKINIFYINEEWYDYPVENLKKFDYVICKSKYALNLIKNHCNAICIPFLSKNLYDKTVLRSNSYLHLAGRSIQKNTELILQQHVPITLIDPFNRYKPKLNLNHINTYQSNEQISNLLNSHNIHICCSLYESWGHYLFEGLSTGAEIICSDIPVFKEQLDPNLVHFIPTTEYLDEEYSYCSDNKNNLYKFRKSFFVDDSILKYKIENFNPIGKNQERIKLFHEIMSKSRNKLINFFNSI